MAIFIHFRVWVITCSCFLFGILPVKAVDLGVESHVINDAKGETGFVIHKTASIPPINAYSLKKMQDEGSSAQDSLILVAFVFSDFFDGRFWTVKWDLTQPMDTWAGVTLNEERRVIGLELINRNINAKIPANFGNLSELKTLIIEDEEDVDGRLPEELGNLGNLEVLRIKNTGVTGTIPASFGQLGSLQKLDLSNNFLFGAVPEAMGNLAQLTQLRLNNNQFTGRVPESLGNLASLQVLNISENSFTFLPDMTAASPESFNVQRNKLTFESLLHNIDILDTFVPQDSIGVAHSINLINGESFVLDLHIDETITDNVYIWFKDGAEILQTNQNTFNFENVTDADEGVYTVTVTNPGVAGLSLFGHPVTLNVVNSCTERDSLAVLDVLHGVGTPRSLFDFDLENDPLEEWKWITLDENRCVVSLQISVGNDIYLTKRTDGQGHISPAIGDLSNLKRLRIYDIGTDEEEGIHGTLPPEIGKLANLDTLLVWGEFISGEIPDTFSNLTNLRQFWLSLTRLSGQIPDFIGTFSDLRELDLGANLSGEIPLSFQNLTLLERLSLSRNELTGSIPEIFGNMNNLRSLALSSNKLTGTVPGQIWNLSNLTLLNLSFNQLTGSIPEDLGNLTELLFLELRNNQFDGNIPSSLGNLTKLRNLFLSHNQFTGPIPEGIGNLVDLNYLYVDNNQLSGPVPETVGNLDESLLWVHLENNQLSGEIPDGIENWTGVFELYAHNNQLSGELPTGFGNMERLRILSLSYNQLSGTIPGELGNLEELFWIRLENNQLSGAVPRELGKMNRLGWLHLQNNQLTGIENGFTTEDPDATFHVSNFRIENNLIADLPDMTGMEFMKNDTTAVFGNQLTFEDILPNMALTEEAFQPRFYYAPQDSIGEELEVRLSQGDDFTIDLGIDEAIEDNNYRWLKDGAEVQTNNVNKLVLENLTADDAGVYSAEVTNPGVPGLTLLSRPVTIIINIPPEFTSTPVTEAKVGTGYVYDITATDPDNDALTIAATALPFWLEFTDNGDGSATLQGTPEVADCTDKQVTLVVEDINGQTDTQSFQIDIDADFTVTVQPDKTAICVDETVTFTAILSEGVENPTFVWMVNDVTIEGESEATFTTSSLNDGDAVKVVVNGDVLECSENVEVVSNPVSINVGENFTMEVEIQADPSQICKGDESTFTAVLTNAGPNPQFIWKINDVVVEGVDTEILITDLLNDGDVVSVEVTTDASACIANTVAKASLTVAVTERFILSVSLSADKTEIIAGETVTFTASTDFSDSPVQYGWFINDQIVSGETLANFSTANLENNDKVKVKILTDPTECLENTEAESEEITIVVNENNEVNVQDISKTTPEDTDLAFSANDFEQAFSANSSLSAIQITALPANGMLSLNGTNITLNQEIEAGQLSGLVYTPNPDENGTDTFSWEGSDGTQFSTSDANVNITITPVNDPPVFSLSGDITVLENFNTVEQVTVLPEQVPPDETNQNVTYQLIPSTVSFANVNFDPQRGRVAITSIAGQTGQQEFEIIANDGQLTNNTHLASFVLTVQPDNAFQPIGIALDNLSVPENQPAGTLIGSISIANNDPNDRYVLTLGGNGADNAFFLIDGNQLKTNAEFDFEEKSEYEIRIRVEDEKGDSLEESFTILVIDVEPEEVAVISGFTPDNDRVNDTWEIPGLGGYPDCTVEVYNSWGQRVFFSNGYQQPWDGTFKNTDVPVGTYYYIIDLNNGEPPITGDITVMR